MNPDLEAIGVIAVIAVFMAGTALGISIGLWIWCAKHKDDHAPNG